MGGVPWGWMMSQSRTHPDFSRGAAVLNYGAHRPILQSEQELERKRGAYASTAQPSPLADPRHRTRGPARIGDWGHAFQPARARPLVPYCGRRLLDRPAVLLQCRPDPGDG